MSPARPVITPSGIVVQTNAPAKLEVAGAAATGSSPNASKRASLRIPTAVPELAGEAAIRKQRSEELAALGSLLGELQEKSTNTTKHADETYFATLETLGSLHRTVMQLKEVLGRTNEGSGLFERETGEMIEEVRNQLCNIGNLDDQRFRIQALQNRLSVGKLQIDGLSQRVGVVRERVEGWEALDTELKETMRRRLHVVWMAVMAGLVVGLGLWWAWRGGPAASSVAVVPVAEVRPPNPIDTLLERDLDALIQEEGLSLGAVTVDIPKRSSKERDELRVLDEL